MPTAKLNGRILPIGASTGESPLSVAEGPGSVGVGASRWGSRTITPASSRRHDVDVCRIDREPRARPLVEDGPRHGADEDDRVADPHLVLRAEAEEVHLLDGALEDVRVVPGRALERDPAALGTEDGHDA